MNREQQIQKLQEKIQAQCERIYEAQDKVRILRKSLDALLERIAREEAVDHINDWAWLLEVNELGNGGKVRQEALDKKLPWNSPVVVSGYLPAVMQRCIQVKLHYPDRKSLNQVKALLREILPAIKPIPDGDMAGRKFVDLFEYTLSANGCYQLEFGEDKAYLTVTRYGRRTEVFSGTFDEVLEYAWKNHYYE